MADISLQWTDFKSIASTKNITIQYTQDSVYFIFGYDGPIFYSCTIWIGTVPDGVIDGGYSQSQNDTDKSDFETNYKPTANQQLQPVIAGKRTDGAYGNAKLDNLNRVVVIGAPTEASGSLRVGLTVQAAVGTFALNNATYTVQSSNAQRSVVSTSANDTLAGTGARVVRITYYSLSGGVVTGPFTEDVTLNGTTAVNTVSTTICFIEKMQVITVGSGISNAGTINLKATTAGGGATIWSIVAGLNQTYGCWHYVPNGKTCKIISFIGSHNGIATTSGGIFSLREKDCTSSTDAELIISDFLRVYGQDSSVPRTYSTPINIAGPSIITAYVETESATSIAYRGGFEFYEE